MLNSAEETGDALTGKLAIPSECAWTFGMPIGYLLVRVRDCQQLRLAETGAQ